jgi:hypothetical protein
VTRLRERLVTLVAGEWLLSGMYPHVSLQAFRLRERLVTYIAGEWLLFSMYPLVSLPATRLRKRLVTQLTTERLFTRVSPQMNIQLALKGEIPVTENTEVLHGSRLVDYCQQFLGSQKNKIL